MASRRSERVGGLLVEVVAEILLREVKDPRLEGITVTAAAMSPDLRAARVFVRPLSGNKDVDALAGLKSASGYIRRQVAGRMGLKYTPGLTFVYDETLDDVNRLEGIFHKIHKGNG